MIRVDKFLASKRLYAIDPAGLHVAASPPPVINGAPMHHPDGTLYRVNIDAMWFRRKNRITAACIGYLWDYMRPAPTDLGDALRRMDDGRYGGTCRGRWDGALYWGSQEPDEIERHLSVLRPMLDNYPDVPAGHDGWWRF